jgi:hypothetical protein
VSNYFTLFNFMIHKKSDIVLKIKSFIALALLMLKHSDSEQKQFHSL